MRVNRLDKVQYNNHIAYVHHISEYGLTPTAWLYGLPEEMKNTVSSEEPVSMKELIRMNRNTDYNDFLQGKIGIDHIEKAEEQELLNICIAANIDIYHADVECDYKRLWFIADDTLRTVQTIFEAEDEGVVKIYNNALEYIIEHER